MKRSLQGNVQEGLTNQSSITFGHSTLQNIHQAFYNELNIAYESYLKKQPNKTNIPFLVNKIPNILPISVAKQAGIIVLGGTFGQTAICSKEKDKVSIELIRTAIPLPLFTTLDQLVTFIFDNFVNLPNELIINTAYPIKQIFRKDKLDGILIRTGKTFMIKSLINKFLGEELENAFLQKYGRYIDITIANDGLALLLAGKNHIRTNQLAFGIIGTGINFGFFLKENIAVILESDMFKLPKDSISKE